METILRRNIKYIIPYTPKNLLSVTEGGSSRTERDILRVCIKISPACDVNMCDNNFDPLFLGISSMTLLPFNRKFVKHELGRLLTSVGVTLK